jgi:filamentous hemagglutinin family protein
MNRAFNIVWNRALGAWVVASEHAATRGKRGASARRAVGGLALAIAAFHPAYTLATGLPSGGQIVLGSGQIGTPSANQMVIDQGSTKLAIDWQTFDIASGHKVIFNQPGTESIALNRVLGSDGSTIMGQLDANGRVFLINPNGILFGAGASVNVGALVASTLDISNEDFEKGTYSFKGDGSNASVINQGTLTASDGGAVALLGGTVSNQGVIVANSGTVALAAGNSVTLDFAGDGLLNVQVDEAMVDALVDNQQLIQADGGQVILTAQAADALLNTVVNNTGVIEARTLGEKNGRIVLDGGDEGKLQVAGTLDASATTGQGGVIEVTGANIALANATLDASGASGGTIKVGGDWQGSGTLAHAETTTVDASTTLKADATEKGDGGTVVVWSDEKTTYAGSISAKGGAQGGDGGQAEVSGKAVLAFDGSVDLSAARGAFGDLLLDPYDLTISDAATSNISGFTASGDDSVLNAATLETALGLANVTVATGTGGSQAGDITVASDLGWSANTRLTLQAAGNIAIDKDITATGANAGLVLSHGTGKSYSLNDGARVTLSGAGATLAIGSTGAEQSYTLIHDVATLQNIASGSGHYAVAGDIDASATASWNSGQGFNPLAELTGTFTGLGHAIDGLTIDRSGSGRVGLFGSTNGATLRDLTLSNVSIQGGARVGSLVGDSLTSTLANVHATGTLAGSEAGGLVGWSGYTTISNASSSVAVSGGDALGGLAGYLYYGGGISDSYATGPITSSGAEVGGLVGHVADASLTLTNVYASGAVSTSASTTDTGGLVGKLDASTVTATNAYWDVDSTGQSSDAASGSTGISSTVARNQATYSGFDFTNTWVILEGDTRPMLRSEHSTTIYTPHALQLMAQDLTADYRLGRDIDLAATAGGNGSDVWGSAGFDPIGDSGTAFTGSLDGQGHVIEGLTINRPGTDYVGLFGRTGAGSSIADVGLAGGSVIGQAVTGALVGSNGGSIQRSYATGLVQGWQFVGGLVGYNLGGTVSRAYATGQVSHVAGGIGGLIGYSGSVTNGYWDSDTSGLGGGSTTAQLQAGLPTGFDPAVWSIVPGESYPYLNWQFVTGTPQVVSGTVRNGSGGVVSGTAVSGLLGSAPLASALTGGGVTSGANGYYYFLLAPDTLDDSQVLTYYGSAGNGGATYQDAVSGALQNLDITRNVLAVTTSLPRWSAITGIFAGNATISDLLASLNTLNLHATGDFALDDQVQANDATLDADGDLSIETALDLNSLTLSAAGRIGDTQALDANLFRLLAGDWRQLGTLPAFAATDFRLEGGSFLRATGGDGSAASPYAIVDVYGLQGMASASLLDGHFALAGDIDASGTAGWNAGAGFDPIGNGTHGSSSGAGFSGSLDGQGHAILHLTINRPGENMVGMFGHIESGSSIHDLSLQDVDIAGFYDVGGLVGFNYFGSLSDVSIDGAVSGGNNNVGALVGYNWVGNISNAHSSGTVQGVTSVGGLLGANDNGSLTAVYSTASVIASGDSVGGLLGWNWGPLNGLYAAGDVTGRNDVGGLVGRSMVGAISNAYATGEVQGNSNVGGLVGTAFGNISPISSTYALGQVSGNSNAGGLIGYSWGNISSSFWNIDANPGLSGMGFDGSISSTVSGRTLADLMNMDTFAGWSIDDQGGTASLWRIYQGYTTPLLRGFLAPVTVTADLSGAGKTYDGGIASGNASYTTAPSGALLDGSLSYASSSANAGTYSLANGNLILDGLYSGQQGYDISYAAGSLIIDPAALTIVGQLTGNASKVYDGTTDATLSPANYLLSGWIGSDGAIVTETHGHYADASAGSGKTVTVNLDASDYQAIGGTNLGNYSLPSLVSGAIGNIAPAALVVTAKDASKTYDGIAWSGGNGVSYSGFVNGEDASVLGGILTYGGSAQGAVNAGTYSLTASGLTASNYAITFRDGSLLISGQPVVEPPTGKPPRAYYDILASLTFARREDQRRAEPTDTPLPYQVVASGIRLPEGI